MTAPRRPWLVLAGIGALAVVALYLLRLGEAFGQSDEVIYAEFIREMQRSGDYFRLAYGGAELLQRPPYSVTGYALVANVVPGELGVRLLPALLTVLGLLAAGAIVWRRSGRLDAGFIAACVAAGTPSVFLFGRLCMSDPPFVLAVIGALAATMAAQRDASGKWLMWAGAALGAAFAFKSLAAAIPAVTLAPWLVVAALRHRPWRRVWTGIGLFMLLAAPWYVVNVIAHGGQFLAVHFGENLGARATGDLPGIGIPGGPAAYLIHMWRADGPLYTLLLCGAPVATGVLAVARRDERLGIAAGYTLGTLALFSLLGTRLPHYLLVWYPGAAVCVGLLLAEGLARVRVARPAWQLVLPFLALMLVVRAGGRDTFDESTVPAVDAKQMGLAIAASGSIPPGEPIYTLDWYAPALAYYADRRWRLLTTYPSMAKIVGSVETFRAAGTVSLVPPWPTGRFHLAATLMAFDRLPVDGRVVDFKGPYILLEVEIPSQTGVIVPP